MRPFVGMPTQKLTASRAVEAGRAAPRSALTQSLRAESLSSSVPRSGLSFPGCDAARETFTSRHILGLTRALLKISGFLVISGQGSLPIQQPAGGDVGRGILHRSASAGNPFFARSDGTQLCSFASIDSKIGTASTPNLFPTYADSVRPAGNKREERTHEKTTVIEHGRTDCRTCYGVSAEHAERWTIAWRRTIRRRRATTRARRASATEGAGPG